MSTTTLGSSLGTGGMETKLIAAEIATGAGVTTVITSSKNPSNIFSIIEYNNAYKSASPPLPGEASPLRVSRDSSPEPRPPHTVFLPSPAPMRDLKSWTSHTLYPSGSVVIDAGAYAVLSRRESGGRLLAAGVVGVIGAFASGQAVRILIRRAPAGGSTEEEAESARENYARGLATRPSTPTLPPSASMSSSISSIGLPRSTSSASIAEDGAAASGLRKVPEDDVVLVEKADGVDYGEVVEVGRGLANYNYAQIDRVKGLNRCVPYTFFSPF